MNARNVLTAWRQGKHCTASALSTDGNVLRSYALVIGFTTDDGRKVAITTAGGSVTTAKHVTYARSAADVEAPGPRAHYRGTCSRSDCSHVEAIAAQLAEQRDTRQIRAS